MSSWQGFPFLGHNCLQSQLGEKKTKSKMVLTQTYYEFQTWFWPIFKKSNEGLKRYSEVKAIYYLSRCYNFDTRSLKEVPLRILSAKITLLTSLLYVPWEKKTLIYLLSTVMTIKNSKTSISVLNIGNWCFTILYGLDCTNQKN